LSDWLEVSRFVKSFAQKNDVLPVESDFLLYFDLKSEVVKKVLFVLERMQGDRFQEKDLQIVQRFGLGREPNGTVAELSQPDGQSQKRTEELISELERLRGVDDPFGNSPDDAA
jgi:hypothetical protein